MSYRALNNIGDILLNLGYGLHVKRKGKYFYVRKCNKMNNSKKQNSGK